MTNPLLDTMALPHFGAIKAGHIGPAIKQAIVDHQAVIDTITRQRLTDFAHAWLPLERAEATVNAIWATASHLIGVADAPDMRAAYAAAEEKLVQHQMSVRQNGELYDVLVAMAARHDFADLPAADRTAVKRALRDFMLAGVALPVVARERYAAILVELTGLSTAFDSAVLDATEAWTEHVTDEAMLAGVGPGDRAMLRAAALERGLDGWLVTLHQPSVTAILTFAQNRDLRARVYAANSTRASDQGPNAGQFDNSQRIARILALRHEAAQLLDFSDPVAHSLATKMASDSVEVIGFLRDLAARAKPAAEADLSDLTAFAGSEWGIHDLQPWDVAFVSEHLRQRRFAVDEQAVRAYFPLDSVLRGWQDLLSGLFGIRLEPRNDIALYHDDVRYFDVIHENGEAFAGLYLDLHARGGKRGGAWMSEARPRLRDGETVSVPVAYLVCNFPADTPTQPSLLNHNDVLTLLHETGHCLHHLFTQVDRPSIGGINGFEWDAVELPSQLMEDFAWDREILKRMSGHVETGEPLPEALFAKMVNARYFQSGLFIIRQVEFALFDLLLHLGTMGSDPITVLNAVRKEIAVLLPPQWQRFPHSFAHIFAGGYAAVYYSYLWAEVLAADGFSCFAEAGVMDRATGELLRGEILGRGATRPAADSFRAFRGRDPDPQAMLVRRGLTSLAA